MPGNSLAVFLKAMRQRIDRDLDHLGGYERLPGRCGRSVSQEELAEAVEVSRGWYGLLESGASMRASTGLLSRIADALMLAEAERGELFHLALPELHVPSPQPATLEIIQAFQLARAVSRKVWNASSETEVLAILSETNATRFPEADHVGCYRRSERGWEFPVVIASESLHKTFLEALGETAALLAPAEMVESLEYHRLKKPGQIIAGDEKFGISRFTGLFDRHIARAGYPDVARVFAHVRSQDGFAATLFVAHFAHPQEVSEVDRAMLNAVADLASVALSSRRGPSIP